MKHFPQFTLYIFISGKTATWMPHVNKMIVEMLVNQTPPLSIQAIIHAMSWTLHPNIDIVKELPSLNHIKNLCTTLLQLTKTIAAYELGKAKCWKQLHMDETRRHQTSLVNVVMGCLAEDNT